MGNLRMWALGLVTAALSGAGTAVSAMILDPEHFNTGQLRHLGLVAGLGALMAVANYFRQSPTAVKP